MISPPRGPKPRRLSTIPAVPGKTTPFQYGEQVFILLLSRSLQTLGQG